MAQQRSAAETLDHWRRAEGAYAAAVRDFLGEGDAPRLGKQDLVDMVSLRAAADRWRELYYQARRDEDDDR